ncbi:hypothetical protein BDK51DRAFT_33913 [Blyttiomyces helicus]|uniref:Uncharacterized protein n=1 Tax=Blyttiomyces helicus TaxID=388810 RepID=A0A4P9VTB8_9FUNG|nr:hypothetical protein BDK51DRAFT_33913 [Blyttiomyces helicus]|eukprot:RKO82754.1 hypothetical protein BDK51DRAFT_33913 [Blyttiomyces helicus]
MAPLRNPELILMGVNNTANKWRRGAVPSNVAFNDTHNEPVDPLRPGPHLRLFRLGAFSQAVFPERDLPDPTLPAWVPPTPAPARRQAQTRTDPYGDDDDEEDDGDATCSEGPLCDPPHWAVAAAERLAEPARPDPPPRALGRQVVRFGSFEFGRQSLDSLDPSPF